jgi:DNA-directed RNA polymerase II subunit RPB1
MVAEIIEGDSSIPIRKLTHIQFGMMKPDHIKALSVCEVTAPLAYVNGQPIDGGLMDLRMGTADRGFRCKTCMMGMDECPGRLCHIMIMFMS